MTQLLLAGAALIVTAIIGVVMVALLFASKERVAVVLDERTWDNLSFALKENKLGNRVDGNSITLDHFVFVRHEDHG